MTSPKSRLRDAQWRARVWSSVDRIQHEYDRELRLVAGTARTRTPRRARLGLVGTQARNRKPN